MSSIILVNDLFEELREENERLRQTIDLMVKYRKCLIDFKDNCNCDKNYCNKLLVDFLEKELKQLEDNKSNNRSKETTQHQPSTSYPQIAIQSDPIYSHHLNDGNNSTADEITGGHRSNERFLAIDYSRSVEDLDVSSLVRNAIESDGEDVAEGMDDEEPTANTSMTLRSTTVSTLKSTPRLIDSVGNRKHQLKCGQSGCDRSFVYNIQLIGHMKSAHPELNPYSCSLCPNTYQLSEQLKDHYNSCHSVPIVGQLSAIDEKLELNRCRLPDGRRYRCHRSHCRRIFTSIKGFTSHMRSHRGDYRYTCNECHKRFVNISVLIQHKKYLHDMSNDNVFECQYTDCHYKTNNKYRFKRHQLVHQNKRPMFGCQ